jgi:aminomethyltransferase
LKKQKEAGVSRKLVGFEMHRRGIPRHDYEIVDAEWKQHRNSNFRNTSTKFYEKPSEWVMFQTEFAAADSEIYIELEKKIAAKVVKMPFYKKA